MKKKIAIIGSGPAALMLAAELDEHKFDICIYERNSAPARKFLVAGDGGFNLTHSEEIAAFISRYTPSEFFEPLIKAFSNTDLRAWLKKAGIETYVGSSKRVFPLRGIKPIDVLNAILDVLTKKGVTLLTDHNWKGFSDNAALLFENANKETIVKADITVFALGGASWKRTGSDGSWTTFFSEKDIKTIPFQASNCSFYIKWPSEFVAHHEGEALKNITLKCGAGEKFGEVVITKEGLEGSGIYALSPQIREQLNGNDKAELLIDLKPTLSMEDIQAKITETRSAKNFTQHLEEKLKLNKTQLALLKQLTTKEEFSSPALLAQKIKALPLIITGTASIDEAISTVGGIPLEEIDDHFQLNKLPGHFAIGEMLDWDAPTGGYLLQGCFSMGYALAKHLNQENP